MWLIAALAVLSCGREDTGRTEIVFWQFQPPGVMNELIAEFERANPAIDVEMGTLTWESGYEKIVMAFASRRMPDLVEIGSTWVPRFHQDGVLQDLTDHTGDLAGELLMWDVCTFDGKRYGIPWLVGSRVLFYNRDLFRRAGLDPDRPPETWTEMIAAMRAVHDPDNGVYGFGMNAGERYVLYKKFMPFAWANGGRILTEDMSGSAINSMENVDALRFYMSLKSLSAMERQDMIDDLFKQGKLGMMISGGWNLKRIPEDAPDLDFGVALIPRPDHAETHVSFAGAEVLVVPVGAREGAVKLARFLVEKENALRLAGEAKGVQPAVKEALNDPYYRAHPMERLLMEQTMISMSPPPTPHWVDIEQAINTRLEQAIYGKLSPERAIAMMDRDIDLILNP
jgi:multiple sugar transport system substrate-binding protein